MRLYNTLSGEKEELAIPEGRPLRMFVCGPTIYNYIHLGNARVYATFDTLARFLRSRGVNLFYLQNITDVDDKIIDRAQKEKTTWKTIAKKFAKTYRDDMKALGVTEVSKYAAATDHMTHIVRQVKLLLRKGNAYEIPGDGIYFDLTSFPHYGELARRTIAQAEDGVSRIDESRHKKNRGDFCLWKFSKPGEPIWKTPLGDGRPGWHIEDTAITEYYFGPQYDIHGGGIDLKFPHHEAEIAQQESASGKRPFVKTWMHVGLLDVNGKKMAKSAGNFIFLRDFLKTHAPETLRLIFAQTHYRAPLDYSLKSATAAEEALRGIREFLAKLELAAKVKGNKRQATHDKLVKKAEASFNAAMEDDLNTPEALAAIFELINETNPRIWKLAPADAKAIGAWIREKLALFGIALQPLKIPAKIKALAAQRERFRIHQQFIPADRLRKKIQALGYEVEDTPAGSLIWPHH